MKLIAGLGNPGSKYLFTRHNVGFMVIDQLAHRNNIEFKEEKNALTAKGRIGSEQALLVKPQTYMNLSGDSVQALMAYYKIEITDLLVVHDEVDIPFSTIKFQTNRGHGGNNGIRSIHDRLGTKAYDRLKVGVGRPSNSHMDVADHVLQNFNKSEEKELGELLMLACEGVEHWVDNGLNLTATKYNANK